MRTTVGDQFRQQATLVVVGVHFRLVVDEVQPALASPTHTSRHHHVLRELLALIEQTVRSDVSLLPLRPHAVVLLADRRVEVEGFLISEEDRLGVARRQSS